MDKRFNKLEEKLDEVHSSLKSIDITLAKQEVSIAEHIRRTNTIERVLFILIAGLVGLAVEVLRRSL